MNHRIKMRQQKSVAISKKMAPKQEKFTYHYYFFMGDVLSRDCI